MLDLVMPMLQEQPEAMPLKPGPKKPYLNTLVFNNYNSVLAGTYPPQSMGRQLVNLILQGL